MEKIFTERGMRPGKTRKLPGLTVAVDDVLVAAQLAEAHGSPGVELLGGDRKSTRRNSSHSAKSRMPSSA